MPSKRLIALVPPQFHFCVFPRLLMNASRQTCFSCSRLWGSLCAQGFRRFGWLHPGEKPGGLPVSDAAEAAQHGGFLYEMADGGLTLFILTGGVEPERDAYDHDGLLGHSFVGLRQTLAEMAETAGTPTGVNPPIAPSPVGTTLATHPLPSSAILTIHRHAPGEQRWTRAVCETARLVGARPRTDIWHQLCGSHANHGMECP